ncbi:Uncharacterised protein [Mycobacterium tuberculosis]|nr:Uncharacterised protein [Mycobacterium tuberculosis]
MVHSIELVFDSDTEAAIRRIWAGLAAAGIPSQAPGQPSARVAGGGRTDRPGGR